jgi:hypothetical protein
MWKVTSYEASYGDPKKAVVKGVATYRWLWMAKLHVVFVGLLGQKMDKIGRWSEITDHAARVN